VQEEFVEVLKNEYKNLKHLSKVTGIKMKELIPVVTLVSQNWQLRAIHEHLDWIQKVMEASNQKTGKEES